MLSSFVNGYCRSHFVIIKENCEDESKDWKLEDKQESKEEDKEYEMNDVVVPFANRRL